MDLAQKQYIKMTQTPIPKLITTLAIPTIISMLITSVYNTADTYFVSQLGTSATGAVGVVYPLMAIIQAFGFTIGMGSGVIVSRLLGKKENDHADTIASTGFLMAIVIGLILTIAGITNLDKLMVILGATETILPFARSYASIILFNAAIACSTFVLNNVLRSQGKAVLSMIGIGFGGILNIFLDPLFIFVFDMGIAGAAYATILSQIISFLILFYLIFSKHSQIRMGISKISKNLKDYVSIVITGFPSLCRQGLGSLASITLNNIAATFGDAAVAAISVNNRIFQLLFSVLLGFGQGYQPVVGYNYGAKQYDRVRKSFKFAFVTSLSLAISIGLLGYVFAPTVISWFSENDQLMIQIGIETMRFQCIALMFQPISTIGNMTFQSIGKSAQATLISCGRQGIFFFPCILTLPQRFGLIGIEVTQAIADVCTSLFSIPFLFYFFKFLKREEEKQLQKANGVS